MKGRAGVQNGDQPNVKRARKVCGGEGQEEAGKERQKTQLNTLIRKLAHTPPQ